MLAIPYNVSWVGLGEFVRVMTPQPPYDIHVVIDSRRESQVRKIPCTSRLDRDAAWWDGVRAGLLSFQGPNGVTQRMAMSEQEGLMVVHDIAHLITADATRGFFQFVWN